MAFIVSLFFSPFLLLGRLGGCFVTMAFPGYIRLQHGSLSTS